jgi:hypothetical protein
MAMAREGKSMEEAVVTAVPGSEAEHPARLAWQTPELLERNLVDITGGGTNSYTDTYATN